MKLIKPTWVHHDEKPIFSLDIHRDCQKFATGGQGMDSGRVVIWNLLPVISEKAEMDENIPKMLCQMSNHLACVNCVRWSQNGQMLASGSDDKLVMIWRQSRGPSEVFGTGGLQKNVETWRCAATLRGHSGDVLDLSWSPQDRWLASCSIDNTIIVWNVQQLPAIVAMLKGHTGLVKGVTWDPVGKYLASQSDDRTVRIWKTSDWTCKTTISDPFDECGGTTHVLRLSWSSDGQYLISAHAMNKGGPTAQIIEREDWKCEKDLVGHRKAVTCVRFHNSVLKRCMSSAGKPSQFCCLAVGSRDRSLSVWTTALQRPVVVIHELFNDSILDLSWGPEKHILMACSGDGTVACLQFTEEHLGVPLSDDEKNILYQRIYGKTFTFENGSGTAVDMLIENIDLLNNSQEKINPPVLGTIDCKTNHYSNSKNTLLPQAAANGIAGSTPVPETATNSSQDNGIKLDRNQQVEIRTVDGKRRITPVFIPVNHGFSNSQGSANSGSLSRLSESNVPSMDDIGDHRTVVDGTINPPKVVITEAEQNRLDSRLVKGTSAPLQISKDTMKTFPSTSTSASAPTIPGTTHQATTSGPKIINMPNTINEYQKVALDYRIHVHNGNVQTPTGMLAKVTAYIVRTGEKLWEMFVGSPIVNLNFCKMYVMLCSLDGTLRFLNVRNGCPIFPIITLTTAAIQCTFSPNCKLVGVITDCGILRVWNIESECISLATTCTEFLSKFGTVLQFNVTDNGVPMVLVSNGNSYSYSPTMQSWLVLNNTDTIMRHGLQTTLPKNFQMNFKLYPLTSVQASTHNFTPSSGSGLDLNSSVWQSVAKITFIENQIKLCESINSPEELKHWYSMLAYQLATNGTEQRVRLLLNDLLGYPSEDVPSSQNKTDKILSVPKLTILENVLSVLKLHIRWQRIYMEYKELYDNLKYDHKSPPTNANDVKKDIEKLTNSDLNNVAMDTT